MKRIFLPLLVATAAFIPGCSTVQQISEGTASLAATAGVISPDQAQSITRTTGAMTKAFDSITPEQEYYIGRAVAATLVTTYKPYDVEKANDYLNVIGQALAMASDRPQTFGGYHFLVLDTEEINAFAAPGGLIVISRGMLRCCRSEAAVAAVLAHEVAHVQFAHGLQAIKKGRLTSAFTILATETTRTLGGKEVGELTDAFEGTISDITGTLVNSGYSRKFEYQADQGAVAILQRVGYNPEALVDMLQEMEKRLKPGGHDFAQTHPAPKDRIAQIRALLGAPRPVTASPATQKRFESALAGI